MQPLNGLVNQAPQTLVIQPAHLRRRRELTGFQAFDRIQGMVPDGNYLKTEGCHVFAQLIADNLLQIHIAGGSIFLALGKDIGDATQDLQMGGDAQVIQ